MQRPDGWNLNILLSFFIYVIIVFSLINTFKIRWISKILVFTIKRKMQVCCGLIIFIVFMTFCLLCIYIAVLPPHSSHCQLGGSLCWMQSDSMFFYSAFLIYVMSSGFFMFVLLIFQNSYYLDPNNKKDFLLKPKATKRLAELS